MTEYTADTADMAHAAVARGAAWLDEQCPDWVKEIRLERLDLGSATYCVLGQTAKCLLGKPNPNRTAMRGGFNQVRYAHPAASAYGNWAGEHGFIASVVGDDYDTEIEMLQIAWRQLIEERLSARATRT